MKSILDPSFRYTKSGDTDLRKTFARVRREMAAAKERATPASVTEMKPRATGTTSTRGKTK